LRRTGRARGRAVAAGRGLLLVRGGAAPRRTGALGRLGGGGGQGPRAAHGARWLPGVGSFRSGVEPHLGGPVRWVGSVGGAAKAELLRTARAVVFPLRWDEPGGTAVVEALSAGVPVVALGRGALPELVDHGVTGWLADDEDEFAGYLQRVDELDRQACR